MHKYNRLADTLVNEMHLMTGFSGKEIALKRIQIVRQPVRPTIQLILIHWGLPEYRLVTALRLVSWVGGKR